LERDLARVHIFWDELKRHEAEMPFWDDVKMSALPDLAGRLMMVEATDRPVRFRIAFGLVGADIKAALWARPVGQIPRRDRRRRAAAILGVAMQRHGGKPRADLLSQ
jgi:hypothetical protein